MIEHKYKFQAFIFYTTFLISVGLILSFTRIIIGPLLVAIVASYLLNPYIEILERKGMNRTIAVGLILGIGVIGSIFFIWSIMPILIVQAKLIVKLAPKAIETFDSNWIPSAQSFIKQNLGTMDKSILSIKFNDLLTRYFGTPSDTVLSNIGSSTKLLISWLAAGILCPIFCFFLMRDYRKIKRSFFSIVPPDLRSSLLLFSRRVDLTLRAVLRGQLTVIALLSGLYASGFALAGLPAGLAVGFVTGLARLVPYLDVLMGTTLCFFVIITNEVQSSVIFSVCLAFATIQILDGLILTPKIMGQYSGLHPFLIIVSVLCFGDWFGFYGVLLAIPLAAVGRVVIQTLIQVYLNSEFFQKSKDTLSA